MVNPSQEGSVENITLNQEIIDSQKEIIFLRSKRSPLAGSTAGAYRCKETLSFKKKENGMIIGVPKERCPEECRVAVVPTGVAALVKAGHQVLVEAGAGLAAGFGDEAYRKAGARIILSREELFKEAEFLFLVRAAGADPENRLGNMTGLRQGQGLIAFLNPLAALEPNLELAQRGVTAFAMELIPRISRAQSMDALSSMASLAGYKGVLLAANLLPKIFPLMMTAAGSLMPAKVFVVGAGVTGLQACATAKRMGALVSAYDIRPAVKDQVKSVGADFVELDLSVADAEDKGGYARQQSEDFYQAQQKLMAKVVAESDVVITTAGVPGKRAPVLLTEEMVRGMPPRSVIVDVVADLGGNCALSVPGETLVRHGVTIIAPRNLPSSMAYHASQMLSKNMTTLLDHLTDIDGNLILNMKEEITLGTLLCQNGEIVNQRVREAFALP
jgi:NAD(P) transhydrogenase subunit alpha